MPRPGRMETQAPPRIYQAPEQLKASKQQPQSQDILANLNHHLSRLSESVKRLDEFAMRLSGGIPPRDLKDVDGESKTFLAEIKARISDCVALSNRLEEITSNLEQFV